MSRFVSALGRASPATVLRRFSIPCLTLLAGCGQKEEPGNPLEEGGSQSSVETRLFTPWHRASDPSPFPEHEQWYFRDLLSIAPEGRTNLLRDESVDEQLRAGLTRIEGRDPLECEPLLEDLLPLARVDPSALGAFLESGTRDQRYACARLLVRLADSLQDAAVEGTNRTLANSLAELCASHLRDEADEVAILLQEAFATLPLQWTTLRLVKAFGKFDTELPVTIRARAAVHLIRRGSFGGWPLLRKILAEQTPLQDDAHREWDASDRTAWWKEEALIGIEAIAGERFGLRPDASPGAQAEAIGKLDRWWQEHRVEVWERAASLDDPDLQAHLHTVILALGTFQLRNVDNAEFLLTTLGPPAAPLLLQCIPSGSACTQVRRHCIEILGTLMSSVSEARRRQWVTQLTPLLQEADSRIRLRAIDSIGSSNLPEVVETLEGLLSPEDLEAAEIVVRKLAENPQPRALEVLRNFQAAAQVADPEWLPATAALLEAGEVQFLEPFLEVLGGSNRRQALRASVYVPWFVPSDQLSDATTQEQRKSATERIRETYRERAESSSPER